MKEQELAISIGKQRHMFAYLRKHSPEKYKLLTSFSPDLAMSVAKYDYYIDILRTEVEDKYYQMGQRAFIQFLLRNNLYASLNSCYAVEKLLFRNRDDNYGLSLQAIRKLERIRDAE